MMNGRAHSQGVFSSRILCYDCGELVYDLKSHRRKCEDTKLRAWSHKKRTCGPFEPGRSAMFFNKKTGSAVNSQYANTTDFYMLMDVSSSMAGRKLNDAKSTFLEIHNTMDEHDRIAVVSFDTNAYFKLKPRAAGQIRRQNELPALLDRIYARGMTAIWDAIWLSVEQLVAHASRQTLMIVLTDGMDNSSKHTFSQVQDLIAEHPNVKLSIIHIDGSGKRCAEYEKICAGRGDYQVIAEQEIEITIKTIFRKYYS